MVVSRVTKVSNPRKRRRANPKRKMSLKQKLAFGTKRQRAAAKAALHRKRSNPVKRRAVVRPKRRKTSATRKRRVVRASRIVISNPRRRRRSNPAHILTIGALNPRPTTGRKTKRRKKNTMATKARTRRRRTARANPRRRRRNLSIKVYRRRRNARASNPRRRRTTRHHYRRNPSIFGHQVTIVEAAKVIAGGLAGVAITKAVPGMLPASMNLTSPFMSTLVGFGVAIGAGMLTASFMKGDPLLGYAVAFGGLMQAASVGINAFMPNPYIGLHGLGRIGDLVPGRFPVPQNPIMAGNQPMMLPAPAMQMAGAGAGVGSIYNPYGRVF